MTEKEAKTYSDKVDALANETVQEIADTVRYVEFDYNDVKRDVLEGFQKLIKITKDDIFPLKD